MGSERYPIDLVVSKEDFANCGWKEVIASAIREGYSSMWDALSTAAKKAMDEGRQSHGKVLWLLADACSMMLNPESTNEPFKPAIMMGGKRSALPEDFTEADLNFFAEITDTIDDVPLKARIADLTWLQGQPRDVRFALTAIDAYRAIPLDWEAWLLDGRDCWSRGITLALMLRQGAGHRLKVMASDLLKAFHAASINDGYFAFQLAALMEEKGLGRQDASQIAQKLAGVARDIEKQNGHHHQYRDYYASSATWFRCASDEVQAAAMTVRVAEAWVKEAEARISSGRPSHMVAASFYESAIQTYRTIPRSERAAHRVDERIAELRMHLNNSGERSLEEMGVIKSSEVDISHLVQHSQDAVRGKDTLEALKAFANLHPGADAKTIREGVAKNLKQYPLHGLFAATVMSADGRVIAKRPGISLDGKTQDEDEAVIRSEMIRSFGFFVGMIVHGTIWPALEVMLTEHRLRELDFISLANHSPLVPRGRADLFGKALYAGYDRDFAAAIHFLVPQIEHMVRCHLKAAKVKTTTLDPDGIEHEIGLSALMELSEVAKVFGDDLAFEIRALYCDAFGPNLRNQMAHGLLDGNDCQSIYAVYAWWHALKLVANGYWIALQEQSQRAKGEEPK